MSKCQAIIIGTNTQTCKKNACDTITGAWDLSMMLYGTVPPYLVGKGFINREAEVCSSHRGSFQRFGSLRVSLPAINTTINNKEDQKMHYRHITTQEAEWIIPFINFIKLQSAFNKQYVLGYSSRHTYMRSNESISSKDNGKPGYVYCGSEYMGYVGHDGAKFVMVFDRGNKFQFAQPMSEFKQARQEKYLRLPTKNVDRIKTFFESHKQAVQYQITVKGSLFPAGNGNGYWVYETKVQG